MLFFLFNLVKIIATNVMPLKHTDFIFIFIKNLLKYKYLFIYIIIFQPYSQLNTEAWWLPKKNIFSYLWNYTVKEICSLQWLLAYINVTGNNTADILTKEAWHLNNANTICVILSDANAVAKFILKEVDLVKSPTLQHQCKIGR